MLLDGIDEGLVHGPGGDEDQRGGLERVGDVVDERCDVVLTGELLDVAGDDDAPRGEERRSARGIDDARDLVDLVGDVVDDECRDLRRLRARGRG